MPHRLNEHRAILTFITSAAMPYQIYQACLATGIVSNTAYCQLALCEALSRDLGIPVQDLYDALPPSRTNAKHLYNPNESRKSAKVGGDRQMIGPANTIEEVR